MGGDVVVVTPVVSCAYYVDVALNRSSREIDSVWRNYFPRGLSTARGGRGEKEGFSALPYSTHWTVMLETVDAKTHVGEDALMG